MRTCIKAWMSLNLGQIPLLTSGGKAALGFGAGQIRTLVSMAMDSSHRVIMGKRASSRFLGFF